MNKEEFVNYVVNKFENYTEFLNHKCYQLARKRKYLDDIRNEFNRKIL